MKTICSRIARAARDIARPARQIASLAREIGRAARRLVPAAHRAGPPARQVTGLLRSFSSSAAGHTAVVAFGVVGSAGVAFAQSLMGLGAAPGGTSAFEAKAISADGSVVVGVADGEAARWTASTGVVALGTGDRTVAAAASGDGSVIVGTNIASQRAFRWTSGGGMVLLPITIAGSTSGASGISSDGAVIVGTMTEGNSFGQACRWDGGVALAKFDGAFGAGATAVSANGVVVVGYGDHGFNSLATPFRWGGSSFGDLGSPGLARAVSADGSVVVGLAGTAPASYPFRWTAGEGVVALSLPTSIAYSAYGVSADGKVVVGERGGAFVWTTTNGMRSITSLLQWFGINVADWQLGRALGVSADGLTIVGSGNHNGVFESWIAVLPCLSPPTISPAGQPAAAFTCLNRAGLFIVAPVGTGPFAFQWQVEDGAFWRDVAEGAGIVLGGVPQGQSSGSTTEQFRWFNAPIRPNLGRVRCVVTNACGSVTSDAATLTVCLADFNCDGEVNPDDLGDYITCFFSEPPCPTADFNADGEINPDDLGDYITTFFGPAC